MPIPSHKVSRTLIIPDVHQNLAWVERVLVAEVAADRIIFLGDYFDSNQPMVASVVETCEFMLAVQQKHGERVTFLLGNHDIQYLEAKPYYDRHKTPPFLNYQCGSAYSPATAQSIAECLGKEFWDSARLFVAVDGWIVSHAGIAAAHWPRAATAAESLSRLEVHCVAALRGLRGASDPLLEAGRCRGGDQDIGGITWLDWNWEFADEEIPYPQIVGHTTSISGARQKGRSWCLDGVQTTYGVLADGKLRIGSA